MAERRASRAITHPQELTAQDRGFIAEALELAAQGGPEVHPNPRVGALVTSAAPDTCVIGRGHHQRYGAAHAEALAFAACTAPTEGSTLYCSLEPCSFEADDKHQPACTRAIIEAGVARVVIGQIDPNPRVRGDGIRYLLDAGIDVVLAPDPTPYWLINPVFNTVMALGRPFVHCRTGSQQGPEADDGILYEVETTLPSLRTVAADTRSILLRCSDGVPKLAAPWCIDYVDGQPTDTWLAALGQSSAAGAPSGAYR